MFGFLSKDRSLFRKQWTRELSYWSWDRLCIPTRTWLWSTISVIYRIENQSTLVRPWFIHHCGYHLMIWASRYELIGWLHHGKIRKGNKPKMGQHFSFGTDVMICPERWFTPRTGGQIYRPPQPAWWLNHIVSCRSYRNQTTDLPIYPCNLLGSVFQALEVVEKTFTVQLGELSVCLNESTTVFVA